MERCSMKAHWVLALGFSFEITGYREQSGADLKAAVRRPTGSDV
jgi:hypothetical protein